MGSRDHAEKCLVCGMDSGGMNDAECLCVGAVPPLSSAVMCTRHDPPVSISLCWCSKDWMVLRGQMIEQERRAIAAERDESIALRMTRREARAPDGAAAMTPVDPLRALIAGIVREEVARWMT